MRRMIVLTALLAATSILPGCVQEVSLNSGRQEATAYAPGTDHIVGYRDTPLLPDGRWHIHDPDRPSPEHVQPGGGLLIPPPSDAVILFDGAGLANWAHIKQGVPEWIVEDGVLRVAPYVGDDEATDIETRKAFGDIQLHLEWRTPSIVENGAQARGNSGVLLMGRYEIQILDSFENPTYADGHASAIYGWKPPLKNASLPPGEWQSFDIVFEAPRFDEDRLQAPAYVTVFHNGVLTHHQQEIPGIPTHRKMLPYTKHEPKAPIRLQNHRSAVEFRNIWVRELELGSRNPGG